MTIEATEHVGHEATEEPRQKRSSGIRWLGSVVDEAAKIRVVERRASDGPLVERLLRGVVHQSARHAAVRLHRGSGSLTYHDGDAWEPTRALPVTMLSDLRAQLNALVARAEPSCDRGTSFAIELIVAELGYAAFRLHLAEPGSLWLISPISHGEIRPSIVDSEHARIRRELFAGGRALLERGAHRDASATLEEALAMSEVLGSHAEQLHVRLTLGCALELSGQFLMAERHYKVCLRRIEEAYGRHDLQRATIFARLAHCAATRGDRSVGEMWRLRGQDGQMLIAGL